LEEAAVWHKKQSQQRLLDFQRHIQENLEIDQSYRTGYVVA
jgi:hypothetical protein